jgi:2,3,4,5-tetrahydropyridine-2-carboxylate N-succinyltransferase
MLPSEIEPLFENPPAEYTEAHFRLFSEFKQALNRGDIRAAEPDSSTHSGWRTNSWVKKGILLGFRMGVIIDMSIDAARQPFIDKSTYPPRAIATADGIRIVPGGSSIRDGAYIGRGVVCMPPMFINVGAYVGEGSMIDSHALVGSCAQIGRNCHISAGAQIGGVLEPVGALPVIVEDQVLVGGNCGVYEGTVIKRGAVLGTGTWLNRSTPVYDIVNAVVHSVERDAPLIIPENAVVVPGSRPISTGPGHAWGLSLYAAVIVKYRDAKTDTRVELEDLLR